MKKTTRKACKKQHIQHAFQHHVSKLSLTSASLMFNTLFICTILGGIGETTDDRAPALSV